MKREKVFLDTEFTGLYQNSSLISIGLISETGKKFYGEISDYKNKMSQIDPWVKDNVIKTLASESQENADLIGKMTQIKSMEQGPESYIKRRIED